MSEIQINIVEANNGFMMFIRFKGEKEPAPDKYIATTKEALLESLKKILGI